MRSNITRDITYASAARTRTGRAVIRMLENATGRLALIRRAAGYDAEIAQGRSFWDVIPARYGLSLHISGGDLAHIPRTGPLVVIANHPFGILDGLMMGHLLHRTRPDFRILANAVFRRAPALDSVLLPISFDDTRAAVALNLQTRARAIDYLAGGGAIGIFPGGTVSTAVTPFAHPMDPGWRNFTAKLIAKSGATVVPVFFEGHNSLLFQLASHLHANLRLGLLIKEFRARIDEPVRIVVGQPIAPDVLKADPNAMMESLRRATYALSPIPMASYDRGLEFEARYKTR
jgi:putative hemolysin